MKKIVLLITAFIFSFLVNAQTDKNQAQSKLKKLSYVSADVTIQKFYTEEELMAMNKLELTVLYKERITYLVEIIPYLALHSQPGATLYDMAIPETKENLAHLDKEVKNKTAYIGSVGLTLNDIVPYADKTNIVWSILFYENIIKRSTEALGMQLVKIKTTPDLKTELKVEKKADGKPEVKNEVKPAEIKPVTTTTGEMIITDKKP